MQREDFHLPHLSFELSQSTFPEAHLSLELEDMNIFMLCPAYCQIIFLRAYMISLSIVEHSGFVIVLLAFILITELWKLTSN